MQIIISNIERVYNGRCGCMCGCNGKYTTPEESTRSVKIIARKVLSNPNVKFENTWAYVEDRAADKNQVVYFINEAAMRRAELELLDKLAA